MSFEIPRRTFLSGTLAGATLGPGVAAADAADPPPVATAAAFDDTVPFAFDRAAFAAALGGPYAHRQLAPATSLTAAHIALRSLQATIDTYADPAGFGAGPNSVHAVAVFYGGTSIRLALGDAMWTKYSIGDFPGDPVPPGPTASAVATPHLTNPETALLASLANDHGATFFVCNNALSGFAVRIAFRAIPSGATPLRADVVRIHDELAANFVPGAMLVPSGVAALNAVQEARYTLLPQHP